MTITPTMDARATECQKTKRKMEPSWPTWLVAAVAMQMDWASIILPMTPPALLVAHMRMGLRLSCWAVIFCRPPKRTLEEVSLPVSATPSQPMKAPKKGKNQPVRVKARPRTGSAPPPPANEGPEEGEDPAGAREGEAEDGVHAGVAGDVAEAEHAGHGDDGEAQAEEGAAEDF